MDKELFEVCCLFQVKKTAEKPGIYKNIIIFFGFPGNVSFFSFLTPQIYGLIESRSSADVVFFSINFGSLKGCVPLLQEVLPIV